MKKFRKPTVENEQQRQQDYGESESIPVFKERGRKVTIQDKGKSRNTPKHG